MSSNSKSQPHTTTATWRSCSIDLEKESSFVMSQTVIKRIERGVYFVVYFLGSLMFITCFINMAADITIVGT